MFRMRSSPFPRGFIDLLFKALFTFMVQCILYADLYAQTVSPACTPYYVLILYGVMFEEPRGRCATLAHETGQNPQAWSTQTSCRAYRLNGCDAIAIPLVQRSKRHIYKHNIKRYKRYN